MPGQHGPALQKCHGEVQNEGSHVEQELQCQLSKNDGDLLSKDDEQAASTARQVVQQAQCQVDSNLQQGKGIRGCSGQKPAS